MIVCVCEVHAAITKFVWNEGVLLDHGSSITFLLIKFPLPPRLAVIINLAIFSKVVFVLNIRLLTSEFRENRFSVCLFLSLSKC
jgi:hypothetical protein